MKRTIATAAAVFCALQSNVAFAADVAICQPGAIARGVSLYQSRATVSAWLMSDDSILLSVSPIKGTCFGPSMLLYPITTVMYSALTLCGASGGPSTARLNWMQPGKPSAPRLGQGVGQLDGSVAYIGRIDVMTAGSSVPVSRFDFKLVYKAPYFTSGCIADVDASGVSALWNGR